jgi:hypothetical protein
VDKSAIIDQTINWVNSVVIGLNFCPFAAKPMLKKQVRFVVVAEDAMEAGLEKLADELAFLNNSTEIETTLLIFPNGYADFETYLDLVDLAEALNEDLGFEGIFQIASFHPEYCFADADQDDPANYTNRSVYPMLHLIRESSVSDAIAHHPDPDGIPDRNVALARKKGLQHMQDLLAACKS